MARKKTNDDTPLQLIPDGNSQAGAARRLVRARGRTTLKCYYPWKERSGLPALEA
jgi:hypothetical protein